MSPWRWTHPSHRRPSSSCRRPCRRGRRLGPGCRPGRRRFPTPTAPPKTAASATRKPTQLRGDAHASWYPASSTAVLTAASSTGSALVIGEAAGLEHDVDRLDARDLLDLLGDRGDAVAAGHAGHGVGLGGAHGGLPLGGIRNGRGGRWPRRPPRASARLRGRRRGGLHHAVVRWSSSSPRATDCSAEVIAETWVRMSMQYLSSSTMRWSPRAWPSIRRSRRR